MQGFLLNRMVIGVAAEVRRLLEALTGGSLREIDDPAALRAQPVGVLAVGWRHLMPDGSERFGFDVLPEALRHARPQLLVFVIPDQLEEGRYRRERAAFEVATAGGLDVWVLEVGVLRRLGHETALAAAARALSGVSTPARVRRLLAADV